jgi:tRNA threonylcarbamoyladenosine biosynthesis protein TsaE
MPFLGVSILKLFDNEHILAESCKDTERIAINAARYVFPGLVVLLSGDLGSGKTFFARVLSIALGAENPRSPSFTLVNEYKGKLPIAHVDLYRTEKGFHPELDLDYYLANGFLILLEWPERLVDYDFDNFWNINIQFDTFENNSSLLSYELEKRLISLNSEGFEAKKKMEELITFIKSGESK